ncbi:MAG: response regulator, partial [Candidatus Portnoybacteria bacterium]|nr:response regulator [Candidatus Portnoybacteria bacterium]
MDDSEAVLDTTKRMLESFGFEVQIAENGKNGFNLFQKDQFDGVFTDINMPVMGGVELIRKIRTLGSKVVIAAMSGGNTDDWKEVVLKIGADHALEKPFGVEEVEKICQSIQ